MNVRVMTNTHANPDPGHPSPEAAATKGARRSAAPGRQARRGARGKRKAKKAPARAKQRNTARKDAPVARSGSKKAEVLALLRRAQGATLAEILQLTGWQPHTVRGFISGTLVKKMGLTVESKRNKAGERAYRIQ